MEPLSGEQLAGASFVLPPRCLSTLPIPCLVGAIFVHLVAANHVVIPLHDADLGQRHEPWAYRVLERDRVDGPLTR